MSYAIASVYYGLPLKAGNSYSESGRSERIKDALENREDGFHTDYSGHASIRPGAFGIDLESSMDECSHHTDLSSLRITPSDEEIAEYQRLYDDLDDELKADLAVFGEPRVFILWASS
jgi:hypothetical protein